MNESIWNIVQFAVFISLISSIGSVDRNNFKTCDQSGFCRRNRKIVARESSYVLQKDTIKTEPSYFSGEILNTQNNVVLKLEFFSLANNTGRLKINEKNPIKARYEVKESLVSELKYDSLSVKETGSNTVTYSFGDNQVIVNYQPFRMDFYSGEEVVLTFNSRGLMNFEHLRLKPAPPEEKPVDPDSDVENPEDQKKEENVENAPENNPPAPPEEEETDLWEETYKSFTDSKPNGPSSIGIDLTFYGFDNVYGIPEHADDFSLKSTKDTDPYRLYNLDVFEYELDNPMALYGSVPYMIGHRQDKTVGVFWNNAAEMWIDIDKKTNQNVVMSVVNYVKGETQVPQVDTHWFAESGIIDIFFFMGPKPKDVTFQYTRVTGTAPVPPIFALGYHQSRWNYNDQDDVDNVANGFEEHDIPFDVLWLDIEHTDGKKYFTWDVRKFPDSIAMIEKIASKGRKMVTITDPHIKRASGYFVFDEGTSKSYFVKNKDGGDFDGWCWPGSSSYVDFLNPEASNWWSSLYDPANYKGTTLNLYTWIDMNEPSVFNGPEITMQKDSKHHGDVESRDIHNIYGLTHHKSTYNGHILRSSGKLRPFILSRSFFAGTQKYGAIWTGDNTAEWSHLKASIPMLLSISVAGIPFCGADVGGFFRDPEPTLLVRWYQAAAFQPFFRGHAHIDTKRREPWLFGDEVMKQIRETIRIRYSFLPYWYTLFYEQELNGVPVMRPLWMEFPSDKNTFAIQGQYLIGEGLLVHPVVESAVSSVGVYFPENSIWYDIVTKQKHEGPSTASIPVTIDTIPVFQRGGTIIPKKERIRRALSLTINDPYTLIVALDKDGKAEGHLYIDDGDSFEYQNGAFAYMKLTFENNKLKCSQLSKSKQYKTKSWLERVIIIGVKSNPSTIYLNSPTAKAEPLESSYQPDVEEVVIRKPGVNMAEEWTIFVQ
ncbi:Neutral alpha-glucosidase AB [Nymphon striatum]|nr:Neutral alpha-glucosidase AB [Nymphon striatum]